jgi:hypothetical protein
VCLNELALPQSDAKANSWLPGDRAWPLPAGLTVGPIELGSLGWETWGRSAQSASRDHNLPKLGASATLRRPYPGKLLAESPAIHSRSMFCILQTPVIYCLAVSGRYEPQSLCRNGIIRQKHPGRPDSVQPSPQTWTKDNMEGMIKPSVPDAVKMMSLDELS